MKRAVRLQVLLSATERRAVDDFRFEERLPTRAAAVRELLRRGLQAGRQDVPVEVKCGSETSRE